VNTDDARALLSRPKMLLLDEPTTGLDPRSKREVQEVVHQVAARLALDALAADPAIQVVVFPENSAKWIPRSRYMRRVEADPSGRFRIRGLPPGQHYLAFATDYLEDGEHLDPEFLTEISSVAVPFALDEAEKRTLDLKVVAR